MYDWIVMTAVVAELRAGLPGARVERIYQPTRPEVLLHLHRNGRRLALLLSAHPRLSRLHLSRLGYHNPLQPPPFCMLLRKYLTGGRLETLQQPPGERLLEFTFSPPWGRKQVFLLAEIMGRRSNLLLLDEKRVILGALRLVSGTRNRYRAVQVGEAYCPPPPQEKLDILTVDPAVAAHAVKEQLQKGKMPEQALRETVRGISPLLARELLYRCRFTRRNPESAPLYLALKTRRFFRKVTVEPATPEAAWKEGLFAAYPLTFLPAEQRERFHSMNDLCDLFFERAVRAEKEKQLRQSLGDAVRQRLTRTGRRQELQQADLDRFTRGETHRLHGELILTYLSRIPPRAGRVVLPDPYHPGKQIPVELLPSLSPSANAQRFFHLYRKAKSGLKQAGQRLTQTREEIRYLEGVLFAIENGDRETLAEIESELAEQGLTREGNKRRQNRNGKDKKSGGKKVREKDKIRGGETHPLQFVSSGGYTLLVGRNNRQNERLTFRTASRHDLWLHAHELPGSHVLARNLPLPPPQADLEEAALLAAHFGKGRHNPAVAVDYTEIRHVRRAPGGRPGRVLYTNHGTITVNPAGPRLQELLARQVQQASPPE